MKEFEFKNWLLKNHIPSRVVSDTLSRCKRVENHEGNLDDIYDNGFAHDLIKRLTYTQRNKETNSPVSHSIPINGDKVTGTRSLKEAVSKYFDFRIDCCPGTPHKTVTDPLVLKLKAKNDELFSFYIAETRSILTKQQNEELADVSVVIEDNREPYFEVVGRYDLRDIILELQNALRNVEGIGDFRRFIEELLSLLEWLLELESKMYQMIDNSENLMFILPGTTFSNFIPYTQSIDSVEKKIIDVIDRIQDMLENGNFPENVRKTIRKILEGILSKLTHRKKCISLLGTFTAKDMTITLYKGSIEKWLPNADFFSKLLNVYSHELFHAYHYVHMLKRDKWKYDDKSRIVKESLARYIEFRYGLSHICETDVSADLIRMWNDNDMYDFHYAGAKFVERYQGLCELMFKDSAANGTEKAFHLIETVYKLPYDASGI